MTYFDAVLNDDMVPLFNGTPEETKKWLEANSEDPDAELVVCLGKNMHIVSVPEYLNS